MLGANAFGWAYLGQAYGAVGTPPTFPIRLSQEALEVLEAAGNKARVSQVAIEVVDQVSVDARIRLSQIAAEVLKQRNVTTFVGMSQLAIEVLVPPAPFPGQGRFWAQIV